MGTKCETSISFMTFCGCLCWIRLIRTETSSHCSVLSSVTFHFSSPLRSLCLLISPMIVSCWLAVNINKFFSRDLTRHLSSRWSLFSTAPIRSKRVVFRPITCRPFHSRRLTTPSPMDTWFTRCLKPTRKTIETAFACHRRVSKRRYGIEFLPSTPKVFGSLVKIHEKYIKNAQKTRQIDWRNVYQPNSSHWEVTAKNCFWSLPLHSRDLRISAPTVFFWRQHCEAPNFRFKRYFLINSFLLLELQTPLLAPKRSCPLKIAKKILKIELSLSISFYLLRNI